MRELEGAVRLWGAFCEGCMGFPYLGTSGSLLSRCGRDAARSRRSHVLWCRGCGGWRARCWGTSHSRLPCGARWRTLDCHRPRGAYTGRRRARRGRSFRDHFLLRRSFPDRATRDPRHGGLARPAQRDLLDGPPGCLLFRRDLAHRRLRSRRLAPFLAWALGFLFASRPLERLTGESRLLACAPRLALGLFQSLARPLEFFLRDAHSLLGDVREQPGALRGFGRGVLFAACLFHLRLCEAKRASVSHKQLGVTTPASYPQNLCITMWTERPPEGKGRAPARTCVTVRAFSPAAGAAGSASLRARRRTSWR